VTIVTALGLAIAMISAIVGWFWSSPPKLEPLTGTLNIAVTPFRVTEGSNGEGEVTDVSTSLARGFSETLLRHFSDHTGYDVAVGVRDLQVTAGSPSDDIDLAARKVLAHIVIFGSLRTEPRRTVLEPSIYIRSSALPYAVEMAGLNSLGPPVRAVGDLNDGDPRLLEKIRSELTERAAGAGHLAKAILLLGDDHYAAAMGQLMAVSTPSSSQQGPLRELFVATTRLKMGELDAAGASYEKILLREPTYSRALLGLAEVEFQRAVQARECNSGRGVHRARAHALLDRTAAAPAAPGAYITEKVVVSRVRLAICTGAAGSLRQLDDVVSRLQQDPDGAAVLAEALMARGVALTQRQDSNSVAAAVRDFEAVTALPISRQSHGLAQWQLGLAHRRLGAVEDAKQALEGALEDFTSLAAVAGPPLADRLQEPIQDITSDLKTLS
jgi:hypothetical protein